MKSVSEDSVNPRPFSCEFNPKRVVVVVCVSLKMGLTETNTGSFK